MEKEIMQSKFKKICVFCGSSPGKKSSYKDAAVELGKELVRQNALFFPLFPTLHLILVVVTPSVLIFPLFLNSVSSQI